MPTIRLDKYLSRLTLFSRKRSTPVIKKGGFSINDEQVFDRNITVQDGDIISRDDTTLGPITIPVKTSLTLLVDKPANYVSSDVSEAGYPSRKELLIGTERERFIPILHIAGRLDVDTTGLILVTSDGKLNHRITSPRRHLPKTYLVTTRDPIDAKQCTYLRKGVILDDGYKTKPASVEQLSDHQLHLTLTEGKHHQVKRMLETIGNEVTALERISIGPRTLAEIKQKKHAIKEITPQEMNKVLDWD